jgi:hypothetical protein
MLPVYFFTSIEYDVEAKENTTLNKNEALIEVTHVSKTADVCCSIS